MTVIRERAAGGVNLETISNSTGLRNFLTDYQKSLKPSQEAWLIEGMDLTSLAQPLSLDTATARMLLNGSIEKKIIEPTTHPVKKKGNRGGMVTVNVPAFDRDRMLAFAALCFMYGEYKRLYNSGNRQVSDRRQKAIGQIQFAHLAGETRKALVGSSLTERIGEPQFLGGINRLRGVGIESDVLKPPVPIKKAVPELDLSEPFWQERIGKELVNIIRGIQEQKVGFPVKTGEAVELYGLFLAGTRRTDLIQALARSGVIGSVENNNKERLFSLWNFLTGGLILAHLQEGYSLEGAAAQVVEMVKGANRLRAASGQIGPEYAKALRSFRWEGGWPYLAETSPWVHLLDQRVDLSQPSV